MSDPAAVRLSSKGQLVIPKALRESLGLDAGDLVLLRQVSDRVLLLEVPEPSPLAAAVEALRAEAASRGLSPGDVERAVREVRAEGDRGDGRE